MGRVKAPKIKPHEIVGIIFLHTRYTDSFLKALVVDLGSRCATGSDVWVLDDMMLLDDSEVENKYPTVCRCFYSTPGLYLQGILSFQGGIVTEGILTDRPVMNSALKTILNSILKDTKHAFDKIVSLLWSRPSTPQFMLLPPLTLSGECS